MESELFILLEKLSNRLSKEPRMLIGIGSVRFTSTHRSSDPEGKGREGLEGEGRERERRGEEREGKGELTPAHKELNDDWNTTRVG